jgi:hypothetical protein
MRSFPGYLISYRTNINGPSTLYTAFRFECLSILRQYHGILHLIRPTCTLLAKSIFLLKSSCKLSGLWLQMMPIVKRRYTHAA